MEQENGSKVDGAGNVRFNDGLGPAILYTVWSQDGEVAVHVTRGRTVYHVVTENCDEKKMLPTIYICPTRDEAIDKAREIVGATSVERWFA